MARAFFHHPDYNRIMNLGRIWHSFSQSERAAVSFLHPENDSAAAWDDLTCENHRIDAYTNPRCDLCGRLTGKMAPKELPYMQNDEAKSDWCTYPQKSIQTVARVVLTNEDHYREMRPRTHAKLRRLYVVCSRDCFELMREVLEKSSRTAAYVIRATTNDAN